MAAPPADDPREVELATRALPTSALPTTKETDDYLVAFTPNDSRNPLNWPHRRKWTVTDVLSVTGFNRIMVSTIMAPALHLISQEFDLNSAATAMSLSTYLLATAVGPLFIGPLSEVYGRSRVLHASNVWFLVWNLLCGFSTSGGMLIASRFFAGLGASAIYALGSGVLGDVWRPEERGKSLGIYLLVPLLGSAVGPILGGFIAGRTTWRWMFWATSAFQAVMVVLSFLTYEETYGPYILQKEAARLRRETCDDRYQTEQERLHSIAGRSPSIWRVLTRSLSRPIRLLLFHPIIQITATIAGFSYGTLYIILSTFSDLWIQHYGQSVEISGLHYLAIALGELAGSQVAGAMMDKLFPRMQQRFANRNNGEHQPEYRIPLMIPAAFLSGLALFAYGWTAEYIVHWSVVDLAIFVSMFGAQIAGMPLQAYVIDAYGEHTSSAMAASQLLRSLAAFLFPLFAPAMYKALGYGWSNSTIAFTKLLLEVPAPLVLWYFGAKLRARTGSSL